MVLELHGCNMCGVVAIPVDSRTSPCAQPWYVVHTPRRGTTGTCRSPRLRPHAVHRPAPPLTCDDGGCPQNPPPLLLLRNSQLIPRRATTGRTVPCGQPRA